MKKHLDDHGIGWNNHRTLAWFIARQSIKVCLISLIHGVFPFLFETTASNLHKSIMPDYKAKLKNMQNGKK